MKPEQFIREQGLEKAREVVEGAPEGATHYELNVDGDFYFKQERFDWFCFGGGELIRTYMDEYETQHLIPLSLLKRLVESLDLIEELGGMKVIKKHLRGGGVLGGRVVIAVKDHESIYGGGE
ncbi:hypothetical protein OHW76_04675 [Acinetobacter baumannii]|nr:hypothetical protein [Acinetobacter baumannii]